MLDKLSTQRRVITPNFNMFKSRYRKGQQLPAFMENLNNRMAITGLSYEMLKANNYADIDTAGNTLSPFSSNKSLPRNKLPKSHRRTTTSKPKLELLL